jgi:hypothetical protein
MRPVSKRLVSNNFKGVQDLSWTSIKQGVCDKSWTSKKPRQLGAILTHETDRIFCQKKRYHKSQLDKLSTKTELGNNLSQLKAMLTLESTRTFLGCVPPSQP